MSVDESKISKSTAGCSSLLWTSLKLLMAASLVVSLVDGANNDNNNDDLSFRRRLQAAVPSYMNHLMEDLAARTKLFEETPADEIKYWFEYTGPLQKYFYRYSKSRAKADYFEGRDDSGVVSERYVYQTGGGDEYRQFFLNDKHDDNEAAYTRILDNCIAMGAATRPDTSSGTWKEWFGTDIDRCRILFAINTVGAGRGTTMLWETNPPLLHGELPQPWMSEQENAVTHLQRNLEEINALCESGLFAAKVQVLVCEPIPSVWTEWMDSMLPACGGKSFTYSETDEEKVSVEDRPSPVQIVVAASATTADSCHNLKSGFMEKRMQDIVIAPTLDGKADPQIKTTHPDLFSSDEHDMYVALKWSSLVTMRAVHAFLQASADMATAASSNVMATMEGSKPSSPFLIPSFVRVSYVSEENNKVAKWRMHGDFFHPAAWEINKDSFEMTFIPDSLSGNGGINSICTGSRTAAARKLNRADECGQWWVYMTELQMPTSPEVYANEVAPPPVQGGSNFVWMLTERQRQELTKVLACMHKDGTSCPELPQAVMPLGDLESFLINFTPNTALGKEHISGREPGYSHAEERKADKEAIIARKVQLNNKQDVESALFDYNVYPAALFHKDATTKAARARDVALGGSGTKGPEKVKSGYYDVTITKPRAPVLGWCQMIARRGLCTLYADHFRSMSDEVEHECMEACGLLKDWTPMQ